MPTFKPAIMALLTILLIGLVPSLNHSPLPSLPTTHAVSRTITLTGIALGGWNATTNPNPTITVNQGDSITIILKPGDGLMHLWFLDVDKSGSVPNCPPDICSQQFSTASPPPVTFTVNFAIGTYTYFCSIHPTLMFGQFIVQSPSVGGSVLPTDKLLLMLPYILLSLAVLAGSATTVLALTRSKNRAREE